MMKSSLLKKCIGLLCIVAIISCSLLAASAAGTPPKPVIAATVPLSTRLPDFLSFSYKISKKGDTQIRVLNAKKQLVYLLVNKNVAENKNIALKWNCTASAGNKAGLVSGKLVPAGKYYLEISSAGTVVTKTFELTPQPVLSTREQEEMNYAVSSGIVPKELQGIYYRDVTEKELYTLIYNACKRTGNKIDAKWNETFKKASTTKTVDRNTAAVILCDAAKRNLGITENNGTHFYFDPTFMDMKNNTFDWAHYDQIFFVTSQYDITSDSPLMRTDKYGYFNGSRKMSVLEAVQTSYRLSNSIMPETSYIAMEKVGKMQLSSGQIQRALTMPAATPQKLPAWTGLTLMNLNTDSSEIGAKPNYYGTVMFAEQDVKNVADFGFNFVRVPIFHFALLNPSNKEQINTAVLKSLDNLISYGIKYKVHICIDMHSLPGYVIMGLPGFEQNNLFSSAESQAAACRLYSAFARRYADVPSNVLSFNLLNEPRGLTELTDEQYTRTMNKIIEAVRKEDPDRLMILDGIPGKLDKSSAGSPSQGLVASNVAQSKHFYCPGTYIYEYSCNFGGYAPQGWPLPFANCAVFTGQKPFTVKGDFIANTEMTIHVDAFGGDGDLVVKADGAEVYRKTVSNHKAGVNGCKEVQPGDSVKNTFAIYNFEEKVKIEKQFKTLEISWEGQQASHIFLHSVIIEQPKPGKKPYPYYYTIMEHGGAVKYYSNNTITNILCSPPTNDACQLPASTILVDSDGIYGNPEQKEYAWDINYIRKNIKEWADFSKQNNVAVMVQEFGCFNNVPNEMRLAYINDLLTVLKEYNIPWSMFGYWASIGIFHSMRSDVDYEYYEPYFLDRQLLTLLQKYQGHKQGDGSAVK